MNKDNKYYSLVEKLVKQNRKFIGNEQFLDEIIDDVMHHATSVMQSIDNESVIEEFLNKIVSTSIITVSKKLNKNTTQTSSAQQLINKINRKNHDKEVNKEFVDNFINSSVNYSQDVLDTPSSEEINIPENRQITYDQLSEITVNDDITIEYADDSMDTGSLSQNNSEYDIDNISEQNALLEESFKLFDNNDADNLSDYSYDSDTEDTIVTNKDITENNDASFDNNTNDDIQSDSNDEQALETLELADNNAEIIEENDDLSEINNFAETDNFEDTKDNSKTLDDDHYEIEDSLEITSNVEEHDLSLEEINAINELDNDEEGELHVDDDSYELDVNDYITDEEIDNISDKKEIDSIYTVLNYEQNPSKLHPDINAEKIVEGIKSLNIKYPELNILDVYKLRYKESKEINNISNALNMGNDEVIKALNLMMDVV